MGEYIQMDFQADQEDHSHLTAEEHLKRHKDMRPDERKRIIQENLKLNHIKRSIK